MAEHSSDDKSRQDEKARRLGEALRANLRRRKAQARVRRREKRSDEKDGSGPASRDPDR